MAEKATRKPMAALEAQARHVLLMIGFGFLAAGAGRVLTASLSLRLGDRLSASSSPVVLVVEVLLTGLWAIAVLPGLLYISCRYLELKPVATAVTAAITGELFVLSLPAASYGLSAMVSDPVLFRHLLIEVGTMAVGTVIAAWAGRQGRAWAARSEAEAVEKAKQRKGQYDEFLKQSAAFAEEREKAAKGVAEGQGAAVAAEGGSVPASDQQPGSGSGSGSAAGTGTGSGTGTENG